MLTLYVLATVTATITAAVGCWAAAAIFAAIALTLVFGFEMREALRKVRRASVKQPAAKRA